MRQVILFFAILIALSGCSLDSDSGGKLPPETQIGANTAGCLLNGKVFLPKKQRGINPELICNYELIDGFFFFNLRIFQYVEINPKVIAVQNRRITLESGQTYQLNNTNIVLEDFTGGGAMYYISPNLENNYYTDTTKTGELKITRLDLQNSIISGTFWFDAVNDTGEIIEVREGRFDMRY